MNDVVFDPMTRDLARTASRRTVVASMLAGALTAVSSLGAGAKPRCRGEGLACTKDADCCSGSCERPGNVGRAVCMAAPEPKCDTFVCGDLCCPPEAVGCAPLDVPGAPISCQCPKGQEFVDGHCKPIECSDHSNCAGSVRCGEVSNEDFCCPYPLWAYCACDSPITGGQVAGCCMPGVDCPQDLPAWDDHQYAGNEYYGPCVEDGVVICCCETEECDWTGYITLDCKAN